MTLFHKRNWIGIFVIGVSHFMDGGAVFGTLVHMGEAALKHVETLSDFVASTIRAEASRRGLTQKDLNRAIGMSPTTMSARWNGLRPWALDELADVAEVLGCSVPELITGDIALIRRTPAGGSHRGGPLRARRDSNPQPSDP